MSTQGQLLSSLHQRLSPSSLQMLGPTGVVPTGTPAGLPDAQLAINQSQPDEASAQLSTTQSPADPAVLAAPSADVASAALPDVDARNAPLTMDISNADATSVAAPAAETASTDSSSADLTDDEKLSLFEAALSEAEQPAEVVADTLNPLVASITPQALPQATEALWQQAQGAAPISPAQTGKERAGVGWSLDSAVQEAGGLLAAVEQETHPEISPEVESYLQKVEQHHEQPAKQLADLIPAAAAAVVPEQTEVVRVLPVTKATAQAGHNKSPTFSVRWLVEWSDKIVKMFRGKTVYQTPDPAPAPH